MSEWELSVMRQRSFAALRQKAARGALVCPAWAMVRRWKSSRNLVVGTEANRKAPTVRGVLKEAV